MNSRSQTLADQRSYIPPHIEAAMNQHMQQSMPAHLKQYVGNGNHGYVPKQAEQAINQYMQKSMPTHLKQYSGAYMQQRILQPGMTQPASSQPLKARPPVPDKLNLSHSGEIAASQLNAQFHDNLFAPDTPQPAAPSSKPFAPAGLSQPPQNSQMNEYSFITNPPLPKRGLSLPSSSSASRLIIVLVGVLVLVILFAVIKSMFSGASNQPALLGVAQDQQAIIHLVTNAGQSSQNQINISVINQNFAATAQLSLTTDEQNLLTYMKNNHMNVKTKQLNMKVSAATDKQLTAAASSGTYDSTFQQIMQDELSTYKHDLSRAYNMTKGPKGRQLLNDDYNHVPLLLTQLGATN